MLCLVVQVGESQIEDSWVFMQPPLMEFNKTKEFIKQLIVLVNLKLISEHLNISFIPLLDLSKK